MLKNFSAILLLCSIALTNALSQTTSNTELATPIYTLYYPTNQWEVSATNASFLDTNVINKFETEKSSKFIIYLEGHTDDVGTDINNLELSKKRVQAVADYLISKGITTDQIQISYFGETKPEKRKIAISKKLEDIRYANRRVVIRIEKVL
ncbi:OmpA family protein [Flavobacterium sp.]|jgi:outer membrane protein OmpA-like peptidoglycan-associated protein|uniref:OmpA family protein n=1 Tax=Flavobacterium sp. TaxID=239 RepID=UPI0037BEB0D2